MYHHAVNDNAKFLLSGIVVYVFLSRYRLFLLFSMKISISIGLPINAQILLNFALILFLGIKPGQVRNSRPVDVL